MGQWQTVSVTVVDEAEENDRGRQSQIDVVLAEERAEKDQVCLSERIVICSSYHHFICKGQNPKDGTQYADSALSAYDPFNTKMYKGVRLHDIVFSNAEVQ